MAAERSIAVFGAGAVGGYLGARLVPAHPNLPLTLIGRPRVAEAIRSRGLIVLEMSGETIVHPDAATSVHDLPPADLVLLTVRTFDVPAAIPDLEHFMGDRGRLLAFQNGVGSEEVLAQRFGRDRVLAATLTVSVGMERPGEITRYSRGGGVALASMDERTIPSWIVDLFAATELPTVVIEDYRSLRWSKLLLNMLGAATTAILDIDIGAVMADPRLFRIEQRAFREAGRVMDAQRIRAVSLPGYPVPRARRVMRLPRPLAQRLLGSRIASARSGRSPGMRLDMQRGKTEVAEFNGAIARGSTRVGVAAPVNAALAELTEQLTAHPADRAAFAGKPEALVGYMRERGVRI